MSDKKSGDQRKYFSQNRETCGDDVDKACGPVSLANSLVLKASSMWSPCLPGHMLDMASAPPLHHRRLRDRPGINPYELCALSAAAGQSDGLQATLREPCKLSELEPGDLMYVNSIALKNAQGGVQFEDAMHDSHIVMVESIDSTSIIVINPDCRRSGSGFRHDLWGRMRIAHAHLDQVWMTTRVDGTRTSKAAVLLRS